MSASPPQLDLLQQLEARQDEVLRQLEDLDEQICQTLANLPRRGEACQGPSEN